MTGRVKYHTHPKPNLAVRMAQEPAPAPTTPLPTPSPPPPAPSATPATPSEGVSNLFSSNTADPNAQILNKSTLTWLIIILVLVLGTLILISCLLCRCKRRRRDANKRKRMNAAGHSHHPSLEVTDGRNGHFAWNRNAPLRASQGGIYMVGHTDAGLMPLAKAAVKPAGFWGEAMPEVRVVEVEEEGERVSPLAARFERQGERERRGLGSRYYSGLSNAWKRISQIGKAY